MMNKHTWQEYCCWMRTTRLTMIAHEEWRPAKFIVNIRDAESEGVRQGRRLRHVDGQIQRVESVARRYLRRSFKMIFVTLDVGLRSMVRRIKARVQGFVS